MTMQTMEQNRYPQGLSISITSNHTYAIGDDVEPKGKFKEVELNLYNGNTRLADAKVILFDRSMNPNFYSLASEQDAMLLKVFYENLNLKLDKPVPANVFNKVATLQDVYVEPNYRGIGICSNLLNELHKYLFETETVEIIICLPEGYDENGHINQQDIMNVLEKRGYGTVVKDDVRAMYYDMEGYYISEKTNPGQESSNQAEFNPFYGGLEGEVISTFAASNDRYLQALIVGEYFELHKVEKGNVYSIDLNKDDVSQEIEDIQLFLKNEGTIYKLSDFGNLILEELYWLLGVLYSFQNKLTK